MDKDLIKTRDLFKEVAGIIDEMLELERREENGEDVKREFENVSGRFLLKLLELQSLSSK